MRLYGINTAYANEREKHMKIASNILKVVLLFITAYFALWMDVFGGIAMINQNIQLDDNGKWIALGVMLIIVAVLYISGTVLVMLDKSFAGGIVSVVATIFLLVLYGIYAGYELDGTYSTVAALFASNHLPSIFITIITVIVAFLDNFNHFIEKHHKKEMEKNAPAPSILSNDTTFAVNSANKPRKPKNPKKKPTKKVD